MANRIFDYIEIKFEDLTEQINNWIKGIYKKSDINLNSSSPYGQVVNFLKELFQHNIIYQKNSLNQVNVIESENKTIIRNAAKIAGHNVGRPISATGTLRFKVKTGISIENEIKGSTIIVNNLTQLKNKTNNLDYVIQTNEERNIFQINKNSQFFLPIIQGKYKTDKYTGDGTYNQVIKVNIPSNSDIENFNFSIYYNSELVKIKDHMYDILLNETACYVRTGFNGGIEIYFGNRNNGFIPQVGSLIEVKYLLSNGSEGDILTPIPNDWKFIGDVTDSQGNPISMENLFDIFIETDINFSSDGETIEYTKNILPYVSRNLILATPNQYIFHLKKLNMFSKVNAYNLLNDNNFSITDKVLEDYINKLRGSVNNNESIEIINRKMDDFLNIYSKYKTNTNDNKVFLYLIPNIEKYFNDNMNYFNIPFDVFYLDDNEKNKIMSYLKTIGTISLLSNIEIIQPVISRYVLHVYIRNYTNVNKENIKQEIIANVSEYLLKNTRIDRIPKSDIVKLIKDIQGIDSATVYFVSKKNEDYHRKAKELQLSVDNIKNPKYDNSLTSVKEKRKKIKNTELDNPIIIKNGVKEVKSSYDPNLILGIDPVHGDIIMEKNEYAVLRGGFYDRNGIYYNENPNKEGLSSINIIFDGETDI